MPFRRNASSSKSASPSCGSCSMPSIHLLSANATSIPGRRNSLSAGVGIFPLMRRSLRRPSGASGRPDDESLLLRQAIHEFFSQRAASSRRNLRQLFRHGRISLVIGLAFLATSIVVGDAIATYFHESRWPEVLRESLLIGGWVAMWRPLEVFLYDWWPIRAEARLYDRLSAMPVKIYEPKASPDAWRSDWPQVPPGDRPPTETPVRSHLMKHHARA